MTRTVTVADMLAARDARAARQADFQRRHHTALVSFTMNIAGEIKVDEAIRRAFDAGAAQIQRELDRMGAVVRENAVNTAFTGCEALWAVDADAFFLKARMQRIEESCALGRLFDIDVIAADGSHLSREGERPCLICGGPVRVCARSRAHSAEALFRRAHNIIDAHFREEYIRRIGEAAQKALLYEALTTPKPGLVDCCNTGAHEDMDLFSFAASAAALRPYFEDCMRLGIQGADAEMLQYRGMQAEDAMLAAAGANTHKGAIFSLGILCYAMGRCGETAPMDAILHQAGTTGEVFLQQMTNEKRFVTGGEQQFRTYGLTGARGEAAAGFPTVTEVGLPALENALKAGKRLSEAGVETLLKLLSKVQDSNVIRRAGMEGQQWLSARACELLEYGWDTEALHRLDEECIVRRISPGGSADLLAVTYFIHFITTVEGGISHG